MSRLGWPDLIIDNISAEQFEDWMTPWLGIASGLVSPVFMTKFGIWYLRRPDGSVDMLDVFTGGIHKAADSYDEFVREVNEVWWQEVYLFSELVLRLHDEGKVPGEGQCYALPHPALGGPNPANGDAIEPRFVMVMDVVVWQSICAQSLGIGR